MRELNPGLYGGGSGGGAKGGARHSSVAAVKDVWKWVNGPLLATKLNVHFEQNSLFEVWSTLLKRRAGHGVYKFFHCSLVGGFDWGVEGVVFEV